MRYWIIETGRDTDARTHENPKGNWIMRADHEAEVKRLRDLIHEAAGWLPPPFDYDPVKAEELRLRLIKEYDS